MSRANLPGGTSYCLQDSQKVKHKARVPPSNAKSVHHEEQEGHEDESSGRRENQRTNESASSSSFPSWPSWFSLLAADFGSLFTLADPLDGPAHVLLKPRV